MAELNTGSEISLSKLGRLAFAQVICGGVAVAIKGRGLKITFRFAALYCSALPLAIAHSEKQGAEHARLRR
jgi:hypothetical protein